MKTKAATIAKNYLLMTVACGIFAASISFFLDPNSLAPGGVSGLAIILDRISGIQTGIWLLMLNIPLLILSVWKFGWKTTISTIYCTILSSFLINKMSYYGALTSEPFVAALAGGVLMAVGMGLVFKGGGTTGGADIIIKLLKRKFPHLPTGRLFLAFDIMVVSASALVFRNVDRAFYAGFTVMVTAQVLDMVLYGRDEAKLIYIISDQSWNITDRLLRELDVGATHIRASGAYSGKEKDVIFCAIKKNIAPRAEQIVREEDPQAFMIVSSASEIYGEGYKSYFGEKL